MSDPSSQRSNDTALISAPAPNASTSPTARSGHVRASPRSAPSTSDDAASAPHPRADPMKELLLVRPDDLQRERRRVQRPVRQPQQRVCVVVAGDAVQAHRRARLAAVHERPFAVLAHRDGDRLHRPGAARAPVAGYVVEVPAPEAARAVVAVPGARRRSGYVKPAVAAAEAVGAPDTHARIARQVRPPRTVSGKQRVARRAGCPIYATWSVPRRQS